MNLGSASRPDGFYYCMIKCAASRFCASRHYSALSVFKERRIVQMWKMQAGILLRCAVSGRSGPTGREGLISSEDWDPDVLPFLVTPFPAPFCSQSWKAVWASHVSGYPCVLAQD